MANSIVLAGTVLSISPIRAAGTSKARDFVLGFPQYGDKPGGSIKVCLWGKQAEQPIEEGDDVIVDGQLDTYKQESRTYTTINASAIHMGYPNLKLNKVCLVGNVGQSPDVKYFDSGSVKATASIAIRKGKDATNWFNLVVWGKQGDVVANYVRKGSQISAVGSLEQEFWKDKTTGEDRSKFAVNVERVGLLGGKRDESAAPAGNIPFANDDDF